MYAGFVSSVFYFSINFIIDFYISKDLTNIKGIYMYPLN